MKRQIFLPAVHKHPYFCFPEAVGWYRDRPQHSVRRIAGEADSYNIHLVINGRGYMTVEGKTYTLQQGDAFLYFPGEEQVYYSDGECPWEVQWVHFNGNLLKEFFIERGFHRANGYTIKSWKALSNSIAALLDEAEEFSILHPSTLSALTYGIIAEFISQAIPLTQNKGSDLYDRIIGLLPRIRQASASPFILRQWSEYTGISTFYFCRVFKKATGMPPTEFVKLCRLQNAKQLLLEKRNWSVKRIALETGYPSISYFGRIFRENEGVSPAEFRKMHE